MIFLLAPTTERSFFHLLLKNDSMMYAVLHHDGDDDGGADAMNGAVYSRYKHVVDRYSYLVSIESCGQFEMMVMKVNGPCGALN